MQRLMTKILMNGMVLFARCEAAVMPRSWLVAMGRFAARMMVRHASGTRDALRANARYLLGPDVSDEDADRHGVEVISNFGELFVSLLRAPRDFPSPERLEETLRGKEHGARVLDMGRGVVAVTLHLGMYELGSILSRRFQPAAVVYRPDPYGMVERLRSRTRRVTELAEIHTDSPMFGVAAMDLLRKKGSVFAAADIGFAGEAVGEPFEFLGGQAAFHTWPVRLSRSSGAPILPVFTVRDPALDHEVVIHLEAPVLPEEHDSTESMMHELIGHFERYVRTYPAQWLILHRYWK